MGQDQQGKTSRPQTPKSPGITTVVSVSEKKQKDELLEVLKNLPKAKPLVAQGGLNLSNSLNFFNDKTKLRGKEKKKKKKF